MSVLTGKRNKLIYSLLHYDFVQYTTVYEYMSILDFHRDWSLYDQILANCKIYPRFQNKEHSDARNQNVKKFAVRQNLRQKFRQSLFFRKKWWSLSSFGISRDLIKNTWFYLKITEFWNFPLIATLLISPTIINHSNNYFAKSHKKSPTERFSW